MDQHKFVILKNDFIIDSFETEHVKLSIQNFFPFNLLIILENSLYYTIFKMFILFHFFLFFLFF